MELLKRRQGAFLRRVVALALTDSAHSVGGSLAELGTPDTRSQSLASRFTCMFWGASKEAEPEKEAAAAGGGGGGGGDPFEALGGEAGSPERRRNIAEASKRLAAARAFLASERAVNWVAVDEKDVAKQPLDAPLSGPAKSVTGARHLSAGTKDHASTNFEAIDSVFAFFASRLAVPPRPYGPTAWT